ncbi:MAG TPA: hypothetical protein VF341_14020 [Anaeromyxobacteraceae bacterium]
MTAPPALPFALPPLDGVLLRSRADALSAFAQAGWPPFAIPISLDAERRRLFNIDLTEPDAAWLAKGELLAVAHVEVDRAGHVALVELTAAIPVSPEQLAAVWLAGAGEPRLAGGAEARQWVWGPESGSGAAVAGEPVRLWVCTERAYADRLWAVASVVRRA